MRLGLALIAPALFAGAIFVMGFAFSACGSSGSASGDPAADGAPPETGAADTSTPTDSAAVDGTDASDGAIPFADSLPANRDRLFLTYVAFLKATDVCATWKKLTPSAQAVFLTLTARLQGSKLGVDGSSMLGHVTKAYRIAGGENATATDPGSCGGGEFNRLILSIDARLHDSLVTANTNKGANNGPKPDIEDVQIGAGSYWRESQDLGGPHAPFDLSDETQNGAPRGQVQYFKDPTSTLAKTALGRTELLTLVDPNAMEIDQDYDCVHNSNPSCDYTTYGPACFPETSKAGTQMWTDKYGNFDPTWQPAACAGK